MPTTVVETDAFVTSLQRPNNGELADAASILLYLQHLSNSRRWLYNRSRSRTYDVTRAPYGAASSTLVNDAPAIQNAINEAAAAGAGAVYLLGLHRIDAGLSLPKTVSLIGIPGYSTLWLNHATDSLLTLAAGSHNGAPTLIHGIQFLSAVANNGHVIYAPSGSGTRSVHIQDCSFNFDSQLLQGRLFYATGEGDYLFDNCYLRGIGNVELMRNELGRFAMRGGKFVLPATHTDVCCTIAGGEATIDGVTFDASLHTSGAASGIAVGTTSQATIANNRFKPSSGGTFRAISQFSPAVVASRNNTFLGSVVPYGTPVMGPGSVAEMRPPVTVASASPTITLGDFYDGFTLIQTVGASAPTVTMPAAIVAGQRFTLTVRNETGTNWAGFTVIGLLFGGTNGMNTGLARTIQCIAIDRNNDGVLEWVSASPWSEAYA